MERRYVVQRIALPSAARFGLALGLLGSLLPACLATLLGRQAIIFLHDWLQGAAAAKVSVLGQVVSLNLVDLLHLTPVLQNLNRLEALGGLLWLAVFAACALLGALAAAGTLLLAAIGFNALAAISGGLEVQAAELGPRT